LAGASWVLVVANVLRRLLMNDGVAMTVNDEKQRRELSSSYMFPDR
jgi:hypothetical protein